MTEATGLFHFPVLWLIPAFESDARGHEISVLRRKWDVSIFDLYSLVADKHPLNLPAELMHIFLQRVNSEIVVEAPDFLTAKEKADCFRAMLYFHGVSPTILPFATNYSLNSYAGINDRSAQEQYPSTARRIHPGLREGITHKTARIEAWASELSLSCIGVGTSDLKVKMTESMIDEASLDATKWIDLERVNPLARALRAAMTTAPLMPTLGSSILHIWQGLEALFPSINLEVSFRISLALAELSSPITPRADTYERAKLSYSDRSKIAHGSRKAVSFEQWLHAWLLICDAGRAILERNALPTEEALTKEMLFRS